MITSPPRPLRLPPALLLAALASGCVGVLDADRGAPHGADAGPHDAGLLVRIDAEPAPVDAGPEGSDGGDRPSSDAGAQGSDAGAPCPGGQTRCGDACVDLSSDATSCGTCGQACAPGGSCVDGHCEGGVGCPPAPTGVSADAAAALERTNDVRAAMGVPCMGMSPEINLAAELHCAYYEANRGDSACASNAHREVSGCPMFVAERFDGRMRAAGYGGGPVAENMHFVGSGAAAVQGWIDSVYHRNPVLRPWIGEMGYGAVGRCDTADYGGGSTAPRDAVVPYPYPGQANVPTSFSGAEGPRPPAPDGGWPSGYPITIYVHGDVTTHRLVDTTTGAEVGHVWLYPGHPDTYTLLREEYVMYAHDPLRAGTTYRVQVEGSTSSGPFSLDFTFTTR